MLVKVLHQLGPSGEFHADVPSRAALRGGGRVILLVQNGNVVSCFIFNKNGQKLYHDNEAQRLLLTFGTLDWKLVSSTATKAVDPVTPPPVQRAKPAERNGHFLPQRLMVSGTQLHAWPTLERSVYLLADGTRSIEQIATLLSRPIMTIEQVIHNFEVAGVIAQS
jgi:hypothetical protein